ncbi:5604_t:CDS:2, partial [Dentiscutata heterogama]
TSLYSTALLLKKNFTFGELAVVAQAITLLAVELWVITVKKFRLVKIPSLNHHFPSDITIFQIALILGMFLIGIILSPLLVHSRNLAQRPAWKSKRKRVFQNNGRKWTSFALLPEFMHLAFSVALSAFIFLEYLRYFAVYPLGKNIHIFLSEFLDNRDSGPCILSHLYLLVGCAACIWMQGTSILANISGILTLGLGDAMASIIGKRYGRRRWPGTSKTIEGSIAFIIFHLLGAFAVTRLWPRNNLLPGIEEWLYYTLAVSITAFLEAVSYQNDNLMIPLFMWTLTCLLI